MGYLSGRGKHSHYEGEGVRPQAYSTPGTYQRPQR